MRLLIANAKNPAEKRTGCTRLELWTAVKTGNESLVLGLLAANQGNLDLEFADDKGSTAILYAAKGGFAGICTALGLAGANVDHVNDNGMTALHEAAKECKPAACTAQAEAGADLEIAATKYGETALLFAAHRHSAGNEVAKLATISALIEAGCDVTAQRKPPSGSTALELVADSGSVICSARLIAAGANVDAASKDGTTALMRESQYGNQLLCTALAQAGADLEASNDHDSTVLTIAVENVAKVCRGKPNEHKIDEATKLATVNALIAAGCNLSATGFNKKAGSTALVKAKKNGFKTIVAESLPAGAREAPARSSAWFFSPMVERILAGKLTAADQHALSNPPKAANCCTICASYPVRAGLSRCAHHPLGTDGKTQKERREDAAAGGWL